MYSRRIPSSSDDLTFARMTSDANGLKTTIRKITWVSYQPPDKFTFFSLEILHTFIPQQPISITDFALACLGDIKDTNAEANVVENAIGVFFVDL